MGVLAGMRVALVEFLCACPLDVLEPPLASGPWGHSKGLRDRLSPLGIRARDPPTSSPWIPDTWNVPVHTSCPIPEARAQPLLGCWSSCDLSQGSPWLQLHHSLHTHICFSHTSVL